MSILKSKEKTYEFSLEGLAQCKADNWRNKINDADVIKLALLLGVSVAGLCLLCNPLAEVAYKTVETELLSQVAYKVLEGVL